MSSTIEQFITNDTWSAAIARYFTPEDLKQACSVNRTFRACFNKFEYWSDSLPREFTLASQFLKSLKVEAISVNKLALGIHETQKLSYNSRYLLLNHLPFATTVLLLEDKKSSSQQVVDTFGSAWKYCPKEARPFLYRTISGPLLQSLKPFYYPECIKEIIEEQDVYPLPQSCNRKVIAMNTALEFDSVPLMKTYGPPGWQQQLLSGYPGTCNPECDLEALRSTDDGNSLFDRAVTLFKQRGAEISLFQMGTLIRDEDSSQEARFYRSLPPEVQAWDDVIFPPIWIFIEAWKRGDFTVVFEGVSSHESEIQEAILRFALHEGCDPNGVNPATGLPLIASIHKLDAETALRWLKILHEGGCRLDFIAVDGTNIADQFRHQREDIHNRKLRLWLRERGIWDQLSVMLYKEGSRRPSSLVNAIYWGLPQAAKKFMAQSTNVDPFMLGGNAALWAQPDADARHETALLVGELLLKPDAPIELAHFLLRSYFEGYITVQTLDAALKVSYIGAFKFCAYDNFVEILTELIDNSPHILLITTNNQSLLETMFSSLSDKNMVHKLQPLLPRLLRFLETSNAFQTMGALFAVFVRHAYETEASPEACMAQFSLETKDSATLNLWLYYSIWYWNHTLTDLQTLIDLIKRIPKELLDTGIGPFPLLTQLHSGKLEMKKTGKDWIDLVDLLLSRCKKPLHEVKRILLFAAEKFNEQNFILVRRLLAHGYPITQSDAVFALIHGEKTATSFLLSRHLKTVRQITAPASS